MLRFVLFAVWISFVFASDWEKPAFCNGNDCPVYTVVSTGNGYEVRQYEAARWVSTQVTALEEEDAQAQLDIAFGRLFKYIDGDNERGQTIAMTAPVSTKTVPSASPNGETLFTMSFYIPYGVQDDAPAPSASDVFLQDASQETVFVRSFTDYATQQDFLDNVMALAEAVGDDTLYETSYFYQNGYDSPFKWWDRHNEVWLVAKEASKQH